jgi:hypothetical protein
MSPVRATAVEKSQGQGEAMRKVQHVPVCVGSDRSSGGFEKSLTFATVMPHLNLEKHETQLE